MAAPGRTLAVVTGAQVLSVASATVIAVALPDLARDLGASGTEQQWVVDAFVLVFASLLVAGGALGDRFGRRRALLAGLGLFAAGSAWCTVAPTVGWLFAGRVLQGTGPALVLPASLAIVRAAYDDPAARARAIGLWGAGSGTGVALGPLLGGALVSGLGWRAVFAVNVPVCAVLAVAAWRAVPDDRPARATARFDLGAALLVTAAIGLLTTAIIEVRALGAGVVPVLVAALAAVLALRRRERRHPAPLLPPQLVAARPFVAANLGAGVLFGALTGVAVYLSQYLQVLQGRSALEAGLVLLPQGALVALCAPLAGRAAARAGVRPPALGGMVACVAGLLALVTLEEATPAWQAGLALGLLGAGIGFALPPMTVVAVSAAQAREAGIASALHNASRQLGQSTGVAALGAIVLAHGSLLEGLHVALVVAAAAVAAAAVVVARLLPSGPAARPPAGPAAG